MEKSEREKVLGKRVSFATSGMCVCNSIRGMMPVRNWRFLLLLESVSDIKPS